MGLFSSLRKKPAADAPKDDFPELRTGMVVEVLTPTGVPLFRGRIRALGEESLEVQAESGSFLPRAVYGQPVRIQGVQESGAAFVLDGSVGPNAPDFWRVERLRLPRTAQHRDSFRQQSGVDGRIYLAKTLQGQKRSCKVLDISGSGARVVTKALFRPGGVFYLSVPLLPEDPSFIIPCLVKRVQNHAKPGDRTFEYGCQFQDLPSQEQERLVQAIFTLQRKTIQVRRGR